METNGKVGAVKMKPLYALKKMCEEYSIDRVIGGGLVKRYEMVIDKTIKNKEQELENGKNVIIVAHGNSLRGLIKYLDNMSDEDVIKLELQTGNPICYELDDNLKPIRHYYLKK